MDQPGTLATSFPVDPSNAATLAAWDGAAGDYWVDNGAILDASLARYRQAFLDATEINPSDTVLDVGCGTGQSAIDAARLASSGHVLGVDLSSQMLDLARQHAREQGITNIEFQQADAQVHPFDPASFDAAISHTGAMFFGNPVAAFTNIARALRTPSRLTLLVWQSLADNELNRDLTAILAQGPPLPTPPPDSPGAFSLADPDRARSILTAAGFTHITLDARREPMYLGDNTDIAHRLIIGLGFTQALLNGLEDAARSRALDAVRANIDAHQTPDGVHYNSAMWLITAKH
jgi:SAM-dependent methyltransferase